jgi:pimeloyl-ACP methyl ester carboxylesterase
MKTLINGISLAYEDLGSGPPVLLIHGFPLTREMWKPQAKALSEAGFRFIAPDLRGFGESEAPEGPYSMSLFADDVIALLDYLGIAKAVIGGMSMGGYVLFNLLERYPERFSAACFITTRSTCDDHTVKAGRLALLEKARRDGIQALADLFTSTLFAGRSAERSPGMIRDLRRWMASADLTGMEGALHAILERGDSTALLGTFTLPCLVIGADDDRTVRPDDIRALAQGLPAAELCFIPGAGHMANLEKPAAFNDCLLRFLRKVAVPVASGTAAAR